MKASYLASELTLLAKDNPVSFPRPRSIVIAAILLILPNQIYNPRTANLSLSLSLSTTKDETLAREKLTPLPIQTVELSVRLFKELAKLPRL